MTDVIVTANSGSSSLKFALYPAEAGARKPLLRGEVTGIGSAPVLSARMGEHALVVTEPLNAIPADATHEWLITQLLQRLRGEYVMYRPVAVGHRIVHGGPTFEGPIRIDETVRRKLEDLVPLAPLHQPHNLAAVDAVSHIAPELPQVACFDTSFHHNQPRLAQLFALPRRLSDEGVIRYGFHGLSYEHIADVLPVYLGERANGRVIVAHLGNGASMCAMNGRRSVATTMGFTALDGLMMGRRCGSLDAGVVLHLIEQKGMAAADVHHMLYRESGLLGVSGVSNDMRVLEASSDPNAREAIDLFCYRAIREIGSLAAVLGGLDALVFTAGIGENSAGIRSRIAEGAKWLGAALDAEANKRGETAFHSNDSHVALLRIDTDEEGVIARSVAHALEQGGACA
ncbi:acetate/propionate family kinase [Pikeienuella piscinae]|uniref:Acetate kinase n=1 Tax=Pikeienuella piscinae TaxID=2748098 RepID=A0A7L5BVJ6_9RHOB|nr:acetate/propionate family kinase [Pikeienuella piscinae]QIE54216.1 acetate/propionate family kinase [Pikeienuella piscinae]